MMHMKVLLTCALAASTSIAGVLGLDEARHVQPALKNFLPDHAKVGLSESPIKVSISGENEAFGGSDLQMERNLLRATFLFSRIVTIEFHVGFVSKPPDLDADELVRLLEVFWRHELDSDFPISFIDIGMARNGPTSLIGAGNNFFVIPVDFRVDVRTDKDDTPCCVVFIVDAMLDASIHDLADTLAEAGSDYDE